MSQINKIGLLIWLVVIANLNIKSPFGNWLDFACFAIMALVGSWCFLTKRAPDLKRAARKSDKLSKPAVSSG